MSTSDLLQKPKIIGISGSTITVAHPDVSGNFLTYLSSSIAAAGTAMSVLDNGALKGDGFADNDWFIVGHIGDSETEENDVNGAVTLGQSMTVTNALSFGHELDSPVRKIYERGIKIYGAATDGGTGTMIASVDAKTASGRQLADAAMIEWNRPYTTYTMISTDTAYAYYFVKFTDGVTDSDSSDYVAAAGLGATSVEYMIQQALSLTNSKIDSELITREWLVRCANDCQTEISQFKYQDPRSGNYVQMDWDFEVDEDESITMTENENKYVLSGISLKYPQSDKSLINVTIGDKQPLMKISIDEYDDIMQGRPRTEVATQAVATDTSLVVDSNVLFETAGTLYVGEDVVTYTGKTGTTTFTGIPATGTGAITATHAVDAAVWQGVSPGLPNRYATFNNYILLNYPVDDDYENYPLRIRYYKKLTALTEASDTTVVGFTNVFQYYIASRIEQRKGNTEESDRLMAYFNKQLLDNALQNKAPMTDEFEYYSYDDPDQVYLREHSGTRYDNSDWSKS